MPSVANECCTFGREEMGGVGNLNTLQRTVEEGAVINFDPVEGGFRSCPCRMAGGCVLPDTPKVGTWHHRWTPHPPSASF